jgi:general secretion pathway protein C
LLAVVIAWQLATLLWALLPGQPTFDWSARPAVTAAAGPAGSTSSIDFRSIASAHLFGEADAAPPPVTSTAAPETRLNLKLRGTIAADDETIAHAIIADGNGKAQVYFIEDAVPGGARLHEVYPDKVILKRGGALETLKLPRLSKGLGNSRVVASGGSHGSNSRPSVQSMLNSRPSSFSEIIRPQPFMPNGQLRGYRVYPGRDRRAFAALGLRPGDLVTDINGQRLDSLQSGMEVFRSLGAASQVTITIERNGASQVLTLDTSQFDTSSGARK